MKEPIYKNEANLIHCMNRKPHTLIYDSNFLEYDDKAVLDLCEDLETNFEYLTNLEGVTPEMINTITISQSLVWAGLFLYYNDIVPEKYKN